jgi:hypothetical protein
VTELSAAVRPCYTQLRRRMMLVGANEIKYDQRLCGELVMLNVSRGRVCFILRSVLLSTRSCLSATRS